MLIKNHIMQNNVVGSVLKFQDRNRKHNDCSVDEGRMWRAKNQVVNMAGTPLLKCHTCAIWLLYILNKGYLIESYYMKPRRLSVTSK